VAQGKFPAKWKGQGDFIMPGNDTDYLWRGTIPREETPFQHNPERGFVSSANQLPADTSYPYYLGRNYPLARAFRVNRMLSKMNGITPGDMMALQTDVHNVFAEWAMPLINKYLNPGRLQENELKYFQKLDGWDYRYTAESEAATVFETFWADLMDVVYNDEFENAPEPVAKPSPITLLDAIKRDPAYKFIDNKVTISVETLEDAMLMAFRQASQELDELNSQDRLRWSAFRHTHIDHLLRLPAFSRNDINNGGAASTISAMKERNGPGWRMIVEMKKEPEGYGIYAGGQSGNPGSRHYDDFISPWASGKYYRLRLLNKEQARSLNALGKINMQPEMTR
jgi:penicillin amidase